MGSLSGYVSGGEAPAGVKVLLDGHWTVAQPTTGGNYTKLKPDNILATTGDFNTATGVFTVPEDGTYEFYGYCHTSSLNNERMLVLRNQAGTRLRDLAYFHPNTTAIVLTGSVLYTATAGQQLSVEIYTGGGDNINGTYSSMAILKIG